MRVPNDLKKLMKKSKKWVFQGFYGFKILYCKNCKGATITTYAYKKYSKNFSEICPECDKPILKELRVLKLIDPETKKPFKMPNYKLKGFYGYK